MRTNATETRPQRRASAPDTPWGRPRRHVGWSLRQLSEHVGISTADLSRIERYGITTPDQARRLLAVYDNWVGERDDA